MNTLINTTGNGPVTMSSREMAELVEKRHDNVKRTIEMLAERGVIQLPQIEDVKNHQGQTVQEYRVGKRDSYVIVAQLSPEFTARLVDRWQELENGVTAAALNDPAQLRHLLLENVDRVLNLQAEVAELSPLAKSYDLLTRADGTMCVTDVAKVLDLRPKDLFTWLQAHKWIYRRAGNGHWVGYQNRIQAGLLDHRVQEVTRSDGVSSITEQVRVTAKGLARLGEHFVPAEKLAVVEEGDGPAEIPVVAALRRHRASA